MRRAALLAFCLATGLRAQYPPETQWRKIETAHFQVVFPREIAAYAEHVANTLEALYKPLTRTLDASPRRTTVILANQGVTRYSGGFVSLFPREAVFNTMPSQGFWGANDWGTMLAAHEGSYLVQIEKMNHGFGKLAKTVFGESGRMAVIGLTLPDWWIQGEARVAETTLTRGGIGQFASSEAATRALLTSGRNYSYMKAIHGSYRDYLPGSAEVGSFLIGHVTRTSGQDAWNKILSRTANNSWNPFAMSVAMKKETGRGAAANYTETMSELGEVWKSEAQDKQFSQPEVLNASPRSAFTGYYRPVFEADGSVLAQKAGLDTYPMEMVRIHPDGKEQRLFRMAPAVNGSNRTSVVHGKMVLDEYIPDMRWRRGYTEIVIRDIATGHTRRLTHHTRFMNPVLSPDGARIAVVEFLPDRSCSLVILNADTGGELRRLPSPGNDMIYTPAWSADGGRLVMVTQGEGGRAVRVASLDSGSFQDAIPPGFDDLANPVFYRDYVLYKSSYDGVDNIYAVEISTGRRYRVTSSRHGANDPAISPDGAKLLYSDFTVDGFNLAELPLDPSTWTGMDSVPQTRLGYLGGYRDYAAEAQATQFPVERYRPSLNLFSFHSWGPTSGPPDLGFGLLSNDKFGLMSFNASAIYDTNERAMGFQTGATYYGFYPALSLSFSERDRSLQFTDYKDTWTERTTYAGFHVPLNLSRGYYTTGLSVSAGVESISLHGAGLAPLTYGIAFRRSRQSSPRDLAPVWSQRFQVTYRHTPWRDFYTANFLSADGRLAMPGLARHHLIQLEGGYERQDGNYYFSSQVLFPRGYTAIIGPNLTKLSSSYAVPLLYPDLALGQFAYVKRIAANVFYDYGKVANQQYRSTGLELLFDLGVLHFPESFKVGLRYAYLVDYRASRVQPFLAYNW
ncbi:MAG TPA: hypothetical protein VE959_25380 [Bryobacteraceae bacterium]|nr:hypothetical protein [Bryobacteraceae bacterium]